MSPHDTVRVSLAELPSILLPDNEVDENFCRHQTSIHYVFDLCSFNEEVNPLEVQDKKANNTP